jgi:hypothetical protein
MEAPPRKHKHYTTPSGREAREPPSPATARRLLRGSARSHTSPSWEIIVIVHRVCCLPPAQLISLLWEVEKIFPRNEAVLRRTKKRKFWRQYKIFFRVISPEKKISTRGMINGSTQIKIVLVPMTIRVSAKQ